MAEHDGVEVARILPQLRIDELIDELQARLTSVRSSRDRVQQLLEAVVGIGSGLDLEQALTRIVQAAATLVDAQYGALGVIGSGQRLARFITVGLDPEQITAIGPFPEGHGLLGELIRHPVPLRVEDLSVHETSSGFPAGHPPMHSFLGVPIRLRETVFGNLYMTQKRGGSAFDADDEAVLTALAAAAGVAIDNARLYDEARSRQEWLETTAELARGLLSGAGSGEVLEVFARRVRAYAGADLLAVALPEAEREDLMIVVADGLGAEAVRGSAVRVDGSPIGAVFKSGEPAWAAQSGAELPGGSAPDAAGPGPGFGLGLGLGLHPGLGPAALVPIGAGGQVRGVILLARRIGAAPFDEAVMRPTVDLAVQAAIVLELAERRRDTELLSLYADRDRIGRDLHDQAIQRLFAVSMTLQGAYKITEKPAVAQRIARAIEDLDDTMKVIRSTIFALHAHDLDDGTPSVRARVIEVCEQMAGMLGFQPTVRFSGPVDTVTDESVGEHVLAVLREALSNAARHAKATAVEVGLETVDGRLTLTVTDDGIGIPSGERRSGLANLHERAVQLGGTFTVGERLSALESLSTNGSASGTTLMWTVPTDGFEG
ncbi:MAG TPA: GAF domain-containing protein [Actinocrinis sp.]|nr:GAF domain-containing protein [Actinocrinis sp.]